ncbi:MAG: ABC transporter permease, partial [Evtepia sp.]
MTEHKHSQREPLIRLAKREDLSRGKKWAIRLGAIVLALAVGSLFILVLGHNPLAVYKEILTGSLGGPSVRRVTVRVAIPLLGAALAIAPAFKMKFWNIGAEGQIMMGAIGASYFALYWGEALPKPALLLVMALASIVVGGIWGLIPAFFKARWGTNETLFTLMLNYIALGIESYLQNGPWKDPSGTGFPIIAMFGQNARLPKVFGVHVGWIIVLALTVGMFVYMKYSKHGYEISVVGESQRTARY